MSQVDSKRIRLVDTRDYSIDLEYTPSMVIVHLPRMEKFTKEIFFDLYDRLEKGSEMFKDFGVDGIYAAVNDDKTQRLVEMLDFKYIGDNLNYRIYKWA